MANEILSTGALAAIATDIARVIKGMGSGASVSITFVEQTAENFDPTATSANIPTTDSQALTVLVLSRTHEGEPAVGGRLTFLVTVADYEAAYAAGERPQQDDAFTLGSTTYEVAKVSVDPLQTYIRVEAVRVG